MKHWTSRHTYDTSSELLDMNAMQSALEIAVHKVGQSAKYGGYGVQMVQHCLLLLLSNSSLTSLWLPSTCDSIRLAIHSANIVLLPSITESFFDYKSSNLGDFLRHYPSLVTATHRLDTFFASCHPSHSLHLFEMAPHPRTPSIFRHNSLYFESVSDPLAIPGRPLSPSSRESSVYSDTTNEATSKKRPAASINGAAANIPSAAMPNPDTVAFELDFMTGDAAAFLENIRTTLVVIHLAQEQGVELVNEAEVKYVALSREMRAMEGSETDSDSGVDMVGTTVGDRARKCRLKFAAKVDKSWDHLSRLKSWKWYVAEWVGALEELVAAFENMWEQVEAADAEQAWDYEDDKEALGEHLDEIWSRVDVAQRGAMEYAVGPVKIGKKGKGKAMSKNTVIEVED